MVHQLTSEVSPVQPVGARPADQTEAEIGLDRLRPPAKVRLGLVFARLYLAAHVPVSAGNGFSAQVAVAHTATVGQNGVPGKRPHFHAKG